MLFQFNDSVGFRLHAAWKEEEEFVYNRLSVKRKDVSIAARERLSARNVCFPRLTL